MSEYTNKFHTLHTKLFLKDSEQHLILKYRSGLHWYIQTDMEFLKISSLGYSYWYAIKIEEKFRPKNKQDSEPTNPPQEKGKGNHGP